MSQELMLISASLHSEKCTLTCMNDLTGAKVSAMNLQLNLNQYTELNDLLRVLPGEYSAVKSPKCRSSEFLFRGQETPKKC
jgi:hypothetical protein